MLVAENLTKAFGSTVAVKNVSFTVCRGERVAIVGENGAGKTTLLRILSTFLPATSGHVEICGFDLVCEAPCIRSICGYMPEKTPLYENMRVSEYLKYMARLRRIPQPERRIRVHEAIAGYDLVKYSTQKISTLSKGTRKRVALAETTMHDPDVLLLDDPFCDCDLFQKLSLVSHIRSINKLENRIVLFTSHDKDVILSLATRVICLYKGELAADLKDMSVFSEKNFQDVLKTWTEIRLRSTVHEPHTDPQGNAAVERNLEK